MANATVVALNLNTGSREPLVAVPSVTARPDQGLDGDRKRRPKRAVLFMEQEVLERFGLTPGTVREQVTVRGLDLVALAPGARLRIGTAVFETGGLCAPCERMEEIQPGLRAELEGRRGRFFRVAEGGALAVGDAITVLPPVGTPAA
ncbi:MAG TPA: MOSC domain-containing protein [Candidatus Eisenbacteria bacterium]|nr:MOSC domain-containing protein [Candidatus Eisenbacteria bacterium]